ncbi:MAG: Bax inhibitor-1/YccA family protein [Candidatus Kapabacteria bacterium]|nr:Bax inhibitor-1/YccA family protein [Candidatus Kapabacteria bacterium]
MNRNSVSSSFQQSTSSIQIHKMMPKVYGWMVAGLGTTALASGYVLSDISIVEALLLNRLVFFGLIIVQFLLVGFLAVRVYSMSKTVAASVFLGYSLLNGITLSIVFLLYTSTSIVTTFFICAMMFAASSIYGLVTKKDLTGMGSFMMMGLFGIIIASLVNFFLHSSALSWVISVIGVIVFTALTAYDTQRIQDNLRQHSYSDAVAIHGALHLYLDFINLFLFLLRLFGNRR